MKVAVYSIHKTLYEGEAEKLMVRTLRGQITVLNNHIPLITKIMGPAAVAVDASGSTREIPLTGGILEVRPNSEVVILANA